MPQLSLYLDDTTMMALRNDARNEGKSMSRFAADLIRNHDRVSGWPTGYWDSVYGCLEEDLLVGEADLDSKLDDSCDFFA